MQKLNNLELESVNKNYEITIKLNSLDELTRTLRKLRRESYNAYANNCYEIMTFKEKQKGGNVTTPLIKNRKGGNYGKSKMCLLW